MIKNILKTFLIICLLQFTNCQMTITGTSNTLAYGKSGTLLITGTGFTQTVSTSAMSIGGINCPSPKYITPTSCSCVFSGSLTPATSTFEIKITISGVDTKATVFKYAIPTISDNFMQNGSTSVILLNNCPNVISGYQIKLTQAPAPAITLNLNAALSSDGFLAFNVPQTVSTGSASIALVDPFGFTIVNSPVQQTISSAIVSMTPTVFDATSTSVSITGVFMAGAATVTIGTHTIPVTITCTAVACPFSFTTRTVYESPLTISITDSKGNVITSDVNNGALAFTYSSPVVSIAQNVDVMEMTVSNIGTDETQISLTINSVAATITSFESGMIKANIPHSLVDGETVFALTAGPNTVSTNLLISPIVNGVTQPPAIGGSVTLTGMFLKNSHVSTNETDPIANEITCTANDNGESLICTMSAGSGDVTLAITNYMDFANNPSGSSKQTTFKVSYLAPVTQTPSDTPTPTVSPTPSVTPTQTPTPTASPTEEPSSSSKLLSTLSLIILSISFILLI